MTHPDFDDFCAAVCARVRSPFARPAIAAELTGHLEDRAETLMADGLPEAEAARRAVAAMGDPEPLGRALDRVHSPLWYYLYRGIRPLAILAAVVLVLTLLLNAMSRGQLLHSVPLFAPPSDYTYDLASPNLTLVFVTGGGQLGDYRVEPLSRAYLVRLTSDQGTWYGLTFYLRTAHWQPWLDDLSLDGLTLTGPGDLVWPAPYLMGRVSQGRLTGEYSIYVPDLQQEDFPLTMTLSSPDHAVSFELILDGDIS